jgi:hypothetical protein
MTHPLRPFGIVSETVPADCGWTPKQQAALIWQMHGREVTALSSSQASIGNKVIYRLQL